MKEPKIASIVTEQNHKGLSTRPPFIWPETRFLARLEQYENYPPHVALLEKARLVSGVLVGAENGTIAWLEKFLSLDIQRSISLVLIVYPACPTREEHLSKLLLLQEKYPGPGKGLSIRLLPAARLYSAGSEKMAFPPNILQGVEAEGGVTTFCVGSIGDLGNDEMRPSSFNLTFHPEDSLRDSWRCWFQYLFSSAVPLTQDTVGIPHLVPAEGDLLAAQQWRSYETVCIGGFLGQTSEPEVDPVTGEVVADGDGNEVEPWDGGQTRLDSLAQKLQQVFSQGFLVSLDETTRLKPLAIPVKAALLGEQSARNIGAVKQKQSFTLEVLEPVVAKDVEKCRVVSDVIDLSSYLLSKGIRWIPAAATILLNAELEQRNEDGKKLLLNSLGGADNIPTFIQNKRESLLIDLNNMYKELGKGSNVPEDKVNVVLEEVKKRLEMALSSRIAPVAVYNKIALPELTASAPNENWSQPFSLLFRSAVFLRESLVDGYFQRRFSKMSFTQNELLETMNIFDDSIMKNPKIFHAREELEILENIENSDETLQEKCVAVWKVIDGQSQTDAG